jgi:hypothetical protein
LSLVVLQGCPHWKIWPSEIMGKTSRWGKSLSPYMWSQRGSKVYSWFLKTVELCWPHYIAWFLVVYNTHVQEVACSCPTEHPGHGHSASEVLSDRKISMALCLRNFLHWQFNF